MLSSFPIWVGRYIKFGLEDISSLGWQIYQVLCITTFIFDILCSSISTISNV